MKRTRFVVAVVLVWLVAAGCSRDRAVPATAYDPAKAVVRIGVCLPMSGDLAQSGALQWQALGLAQRLWPAVDGHRVELVLQDTAGSGAGMQAAIEALMEDGGVVGLIGGVSAVEVEAARPAVQRQRVPLLVTTAQLPLEREGTYLWRVGSSLKGQARAVAQFARQGLQAETAALVVNPQDADSVRLASFFSARFIGLGGSIVHIVYAGEAAPAAPLAADVVFAPGALAAAAQFLPADRGKGARLPAVICATRRESQVMQVRWPKRVPLFVVSDYQEEQAVGARLRAFRELYRREQGRLDSAAALAVDAYLVLLDALALNAAGGGGAALERIMGSEYLSGMLVADDAGEIHRYTHISEVRGGKLRYVESVMAR